MFSKPVFQHDTQYVESLSERYGRAIAKAVAIWETALENGWGPDEVRTAIWLVRSQQRIALRLRNERIFAISGL